MKTGASGAARTRKRSLAFCGRGGKKATRPPSRKTNIKCPVALSGGEGVGGEGEGKGEPAGEKEEEKKSRVILGLRWGRGWGLRACAAVPLGRSRLPRLARSGAVRSGAQRSPPPLSCDASRWPSSPGSGKETHFKSS